MKPKDASLAAYALHYRGHPSELDRVKGFSAGWDEAVRRLKVEQHKIQTTESGVGWIPTDTIGGAIALLENGTE